MKTPPNGAQYIAPLQGNDANQRKHTAAMRAALWAIRFYKANLSTWFGGSCVFEPTCSQYTYEAVERFGVARGVRLGLKRLARCHPFSRRFGFDPVPESWDEMTTSQARERTSEVRS